ncbi:19171_t:CDS:2, partial [Racocetra persica]
AEKQVTSGNLARALQRMPNIMNVDVAQQLAEINTTLQNINSTITTMQNNMTTMQNDITTIQNNMTTMQTIRKRVNLEIVPDFNGNVPPNYPRSIDAIRALS